MRLWLDDAQPMVRWTFNRGNELLTCQVHRQAGGRYRLTLVPHAPKGMSAVETFSSLFSALHRHAAIAAELRQAGWTVVAYSDPTPRTPTYQPLPDVLAA